MWKQVTIALLGMAVVLTACRPGQRLSIAETPQSTAESLHTDLPPRPRCFLFEEVSPTTFMPDSTNLVIKERSGVRVLNLETLEDNVLKAPQELVSVALSPDGELLAWSLMDNTIQLVRMDDQTLVKKLEGHTLPTFNVNDNNVSLHSLDESQPSRVLEGNQFPIYELFYSPDGNWLAAAGAGIQIWQAETGQLSFLGKAECP